MATPDAAPAQTPGAAASHDAIITAVLRTLLYADVFSYPMTVDEIHRYLVAASATREQVVAALEDERLQPRLATDSPYYALAERYLHFDQRRHRNLASGALWPAARRYARRIATLPFVLMVAVTGSLAMDNPRALVDDLDYIIVVRPGRTWLVRLLTLVWVRLARLERIALCPNYILDSEHLAMAERTLFTAHELAQMAPCYGLEMYERLLAANDWMRALLPNATSARGGYLITLSPFERLLKALGAALLGGRLGDLLESRERRRKVRQLEHEAQEAGTRAACFNAGMCKGHMQDYGRSIERAYAARLRLEGLPASEVSEAGG